MLQKKRNSLLLDAMTAQMRQHTSRVNKVNEAPPTTHGRTEPSSRTRDRKTIYALSGHAWGIKCLERLTRPIDLIKSSIRQWKTSLCKSWVCTCVSLLLCFFIDKVIITISITSPSVWMITGWGNEGLDEGLELSLWAFFTRLHRMYWHTVRGCGAETCGALLSFCLPDCLQISPQP